MFLQKARRTTVTNLNFKIISRLQNYYLWFRLNDEYVWGTRRTTAASEARSVWVLLLTPDCWIRGVDCIAKERYLTVRWTLSHLTRRQPHARKQAGLLLKSLAFGNSITRFRNLISRRRIGMNCLGLLNRVSENGAVREGNCKDTGEDCLIRTFLICTCHLIMKARRKETTRKTKT
jgi:hypothetical protein